ncbi:hypothetical protein IMSAGC020_02609 [Lachnospiraceae bacterium]|nr:hypothetical protein IMSAGC020_02609 [Lachnospiraceae bacterium]
MDNPAGNVKPSQEAAGELLWAHLREIFKPCESDCIFDELLPRRLVADVQAAEIVDILTDRHLLEYGDILHYDADLLLDIVAVWSHIFPENGDGAFVILKQCKQTVNGCGLAGAVGAEKSEDLALLYV